MSEQSLWQRAADVVDDVCRPESDVSTRSQLELLATIVMDLIEQHGLEMERVVDQLEIGAEYDLVLRVKATVTSLEGGSITLQLESRDYLQEGDREVSVDADEIHRASRRP